MKLMDQLPSLKGVKWLNSEEILREDLVGKKPVLVHFWSVSCGQCKTTIPNMRKIYEDNKGNLQVIAVHMPRSEGDLNIASVEQIAATYGIAHPICIDNDHLLTDLFANQYVPAYYLFDMMGKLRYFHAGEGGMKLLERRLHRILLE